MEPAKVQSGAAPVWPAGYCPPPWWAVQAEAPVAAPPEAVAAERARVAARYGPLPFYVHLAAVNVAARRAEERAEPPARGGAEVKGTRIDVVG